MNRQAARNSAAGVTSYVLQKSETALKSNRDAARPITPSSTPKGTGSALLTSACIPLALMLAVTQISDLANAMVQKLHLPYRYAFTLTTTIRFIPQFMDDMTDIMEAQTARGADFDSGGIIQKVKNMVPLLVPLFISAFRRANDLAQAMEARCYHGGDDRTKMKPLVYEKRDFIAYGILAVYFALGIVFRVKGW